MLPIKIRLRPFSYFIVLSLAALSLVPYTALADISLNRAVVDFENPSVRFQDIVVTNRSSARTFVEVGLDEVIAAGTDKEERKVVDVGPSAGIIIAPRKLVIPAGERRTVRIIERHRDRSQEKIYRAVVKPVQPPADSPEGSNLAVKVVIAYGVLIIVRPAQKNIALDGVRSGKTLTIHNRGNTNIVMLEGEQCLGPKCDKVQGSRIYPGLSMEYELPLDAPVKFSYKVGSDHRATVFD